MISREVTKCRNCLSEYHYIRDCLEFKKSNLIGLAVYNTPDPANIMFADILDVSQDFPDEVWYTLSEKVEKNEAINSTRFNEVLFSNFSTWSD